MAKEFETEIVNGEDIFIQENEDGSVGLTEETLEETIDRAIDEVVESKVNDIEGDIDNEADLG